MKGHYNPAPRFGLRPVRTCRDCGHELGENPVVHLGNGVFAKMGLCEFCLAQEMDERELDDFEWAADTCAFPGERSNCAFPTCECSNACRWTV